MDFIESKKINWEAIHQLLKISEHENHWSNFGPVSLLLEQKIERILALHSDLKVIMCCSGTQALYALVNFYNYVYNRNLKWVVSSFGFPCCVQGSLRGSEIVDCGSDGLLNLDLLNNDYDGIVVTNIFGLYRNLDLHRYYCRQHNKLIIIDAAMAFGVEHGPNEIISFHHTKPWGVGEGGCIIIEKEHERILRSIINFGAMPDFPAGEWGVNAKISDISSAFILSRLYDTEKLKTSYNAQYKRIVDISLTLGIKSLGEVVNMMPSQLPLMFDRSVVILNNDLLTMRKYYKPLANTPQANDLYSRIINFPCHPDVAQISDKDILELLKLL